MNKLIIYEYINRINKQDILRFGLNQGIKLEDNELEVIYKYIKNDYKKILDKPLTVLEEVKNKISSNTYLKLKELYTIYKDKLDLLK